MSHVLVTQSGVMPENQTAISEAIVNALGLIDANTAPAMGMVLKLVEGKPGWYPVRKQIPPLPFQAPIATTAKPVTPDLLNQLAAAITTINLLVTEQKRLVESHNELLKQLAAQGYMAPKSTA